MAKICSWCGEQIGRLDLAYDWVEIGKNGYWICGKCCGQLAHAKKEHTAFSEIATQNTAPELFNYYAKDEQISKEIRQKEIAKQEQQRIKTESQKTNPLYDDIHQIAKDLRFIKNFLIVCIVAGILLSFITLLSLL